MARVRMFGTEFLADLIEDLGNGTWKAVARAHTGRTAPGTQITVKQSEIVEASAAEMPPSSSEQSDGRNELEAAMETERKTLPSPVDLIAQHRENLKEQQAVSVPPGPTPRPTGRQLQDVK
jgi:hypothetical protein